MQTSSRPVALVTGGASGIGLATVEHLIESRNWSVAFIDINKDQGRAAQSRLGAHSLFIYADITDYDAQAQAFARAFEWGGHRLDLFFANAGIADRGSLYKDAGLDPRTGLPLPLNLRTIDVNLNAVIQGIHLARHLFSEKNTLKGGRVVVTSSILGLHPNYVVPLYCASKHALVGLVRSLAPVYARDQISINAILPTLIDTSLMTQHVRPLWDPQELTPMDTVYKAFADILSDKPITGQILELSLDEVIAVPPPEYSRPNVRFICEQHQLWEMAAAPVLPRPLGQNTI